MKNLLNINIMFFVYQLVPILQRLNSSFQSCHYQSPKLNKNIQDLFTAFDPFKLYIFLVFHN